MHVDNKAYNDDGDDDGDDDDDYVDDDVDDDITPIFKELNWLPVANQLYNRSAMVAFKCLTGHAPEYLSL